MRRLSRSALAAVLVLSSCTVQLVGPYDETTVKEVTDLHRKVETLLVKLERTAGKPEGKYEGHEATYDTLRVGLRSLRLRVESLQRKENTAGQIDLLSKSLDSLEKLHKIGFKDPEEIAPLRTNFEVLFKSILVVEMGKKRGA